MTHEALTGFALGVHAALLVGVLAAYYKFGDRTEITARSLQGTEAALREIRRLIAADLAAAVREELAAPAAASPIIVLEATKESYVERPSNPFDSERFRDGVRQFVEGSSSSLVDCRNLVGHRDSWIRAAKRLSRFLLTLAAYEGLVAGALAFLDKTEVYQFPDLTVKLAAIPTAICFVAAMISMVQMQISHDRIIEIRHRYAETSP